MTRRRPTPAIKASVVLALATLSMAAVCDDGPLPPPARGLELLPPGPITIEVEETTEIAARVVGVVDPVVTFHSSDLAIAALAADRPLATVVRGVAPGEATITAALADVGLFATVDVIVVAPPPPPPPIEETVFEGTLRLVQDTDPPQDPLVFDAGEGITVRLRLVTQGTVVVLEGVDGFQPSELPVLRGDIDGDGNFSADGTGPIAGIDQVPVRADGLVSDGNLAFQLSIGADGSLSAGGPVVYAFDAVAVP